MARPTLLPSLLLLLATALLADPTAASRTSDDAVKLRAVDSESGDRILVTAHDYISYDALKKDMIPCSRRGHSYYNCQRHAQVNPYRRGCSMITHCARIIH